MLHNMPRLPVPPTLQGSEIGSFAQLTVLQRLPAIARRVITENFYPDEINHKLETLAQDVAIGVVPPLEDTAPDVSDWQAYLKPYIGQSWLTVPWFFTETYFYRYLLQLTEYFSPGPLQGVDPFRLQKQQSLETSKASIQALSRQLNQNSLPLVGVLYFSLWGNRVDLSLWSAQEGDRSIIDIEAQKAHLLVDDTPQISQHLSRNTTTSIDFIVDNAGFELVCDLCLVDFLLTQQIVRQVNLHLKAHPTFVSDATILDTQATITQLSRDAESDIQALGMRLQNYLTDKRLQLVEDWFWTSPLAFWEMPHTLQQTLAKSDLVLVKGDANYRRLLGDRHWPYTTPFADIVTYFPTTLVALRTLKSEVAAGLSPQQVETLNQADPDWLTNGHWGVFQSYSKVLSAEFRVEKQVLNS